MRLSPRLSTRCLSLILVAGWAWITGCAADAPSAAVRQGVDVTARNGSPTESRSPSGVVPHPRPMDDNVATDLLRRFRDSDCRLGVLLSTGAVDLTSEIDGRLVEVRVQPGQTVRSGELLARLENPALSHRLALEQSTMDLIDAEVGTFELEVDQAERARNRLHALSELYPRQTLEATDAAVQMARYRLDVAHAEVGQSNARLADLREDLKKLEIRAPFDGVVSLRAAEPGTGVRIGTRLFRLLGEGSPQIRFAVPPGEAVDLKTGDPVTVRLDGSEIRRQARIRYIAPEVDGPSDLIFVVADFPESQDLPAPLGAVVRVSREAHTDNSCAFKAPAPGSG